MNATLQVLRSIPEMQENLNTYGTFGVYMTNESYTPPATRGLSAFTNQDVHATGRALTTGLRDLYRGMSETLDAYNPITFLQVLL
jgi:hypothetical protein